MLEQWEADALLRMPKVYSDSLRVDLRPGVHEEYPVESDDENEHFLLDIRVPKRSPNIRLQLRYRRIIVLSRLCTAVSHQNPDFELLDPPHLHRYREPDHDKWARQIDPFSSAIEALAFFCKVINLPEPEIQEGLS